MKLWRYVIRNNDGSAPNYDPPFTTLAICKPRIRKGARPGDLVLAFAGREIAPDPHRVVWAGVVHEKLTFEQYWADVRFQGKKPHATDVPDNIYEPGPLGLRQVRNPIHNEGNVVRDCSGVFVLVMEPSWRLIPEASSLPEQFEHLRMLPGNRRGHRKDDLSCADADELVAWLKSRSRPPRATVDVDAKSSCRASQSPCGPDRASDGARQLKPGFDGPVTRGRSGC
jgi:hypothetical protein